MDYSGIFSRIAQLLIIAFIGYFLSRKGIIDDEFRMKTNDLLVNLFMVCTILYTTFSLDSEVHVLEVLGTILIMLASMVVSYVLGELAARLLTKDKRKRPVIALIVGNGNNILIGLPMSQAIIGGNLAPFYCALSTIPFTVVFYSYGIWRMQRGIDGKIDIRQVFNGPFIAAFAALIILFLGIPVPSMIKELTGMVSNVTIPLAMMMTGAALGKSSILEAFRNPMVYAVNGFKLLVSPVLVWFVLHFFVEDAVLLTVLSIIAGTPGAIMVTVLATQYDKDVKLSSQCIIVGTILSMLTIPVLAILLYSKII